MVSAATSNTLLGGISSGERETLYDALGVAENATIDEIKQAYYRLIRQYRPNDNPERFQKFNEASRTLTDARRRGEYDQHRRVGRRIQTLLDQAAFSLDSDAQKAIQLLKTAIALAPDMQRPRYLLAHVLMKVEEYEQAEKQYRWLLKANPRDETLYYRIARCQFYQEQYGMARKTVGRAFALNPRYYDAWVLLARIEEKVGDIERAVSLLERAISNDNVESFADLEAMIRLLSLVHRQKDSTLQDATFVRLKAILPEGDVEKAGRAVRSCIRRAIELQQEGNVHAARSLLRYAGRINEADPQALREAAHLQREIERNEEVPELLKDSQVPVPLREILLTHHTHVMTEDQKTGWREAVVDNLLKMFSADLNGLQRTALYARIKYPRIAQENGILLDLLEQRIDRQMSGMLQAARLGNKLDTLPGATPVVEEEKPARKGILDIFRRKA
ncbi:MAG: tetratricopeptide repeat protein [Capsulimonadales bacterium]|nr:tetratricopeptide repeat protein [Capsulimonadales bacterium]